MGGDGEGSTMSASPSGTCTRRPRRHTGAAAAAAAAKSSQRPATRRHVCRTPTDTWLKTFLKLLKDELDRESPDKV